MRRLNSMKVSRAVRSTARPEPSAGGFSSAISSSFTRPVRVKKLRTALVMLASGSALSWRRRISAAACRYLGSPVSMWGGMAGGYCSAAARPQSLPEGLVGSAESPLPRPQGRGCMAARPAVSWRDYRQKALMNAHGAHDAHNVSPVPALTSAHERSPCSRPSPRPALTPTLSQRERGETGPGPPSVPPSLPQRGRGLRCSPFGGGVRVMPRPWEIGAAGPAVGGWHGVQRVPQQGRPLPGGKRFKGGPQSLPGEGGLRWGCRCGGGAATMRRSPRMG